MLYLFEPSWRLLSMYYRKILVYPFQIGLQSLILLGMSHLKAFGNLINVNSFVVFL